MCGIRGDGRALLRNLQMAETLGQSPEEPAVRVIRAAIARGMGMWEDAARHMTAAMPEPLRATGSETARQVYRALAGQGDKQDASAAVEKLLAECEADHGLPRFQVITLSLYHWQAQLGAFDAAFEVCARILAAWRRTGALATLSLFGLWVADMRGFRQDPRFSKLVQDLGMFDYWKDHGPPDGHAIHRGRLVCL